GWEESSQGRLPEGWAADLPEFKAAEGPLATRKASGRILNALAARLPLLLGGSADLAPSNNTEIDGEESFSAACAGRNLHFGVREHAMGAALNGLAHTPGLLPYGGTFLIFSDYMRPPMRLAAMMGLAPIYVLTHDSIGLGEDGPTHQPIEQLAALRAIPHLRVIRPGDANETVEAWKMAVSHRQGPTALVLTRQGLPVLERRDLAPAAHTARGGYVLAAEAGELQLILIASGSEIHPALEAREALQREGIGTRLVSMPCREVFLAQERSYREQVLPERCTCRLAVEAAAALGWERFVTDDGAIYAIEGFGASAPGGDLMERFGFTADGIAARARRLVEKQRPS
nr:transketolase [Desulfuromonadales bacterium]